METENIQNEESYHCLTELTQNIINTIVSQLELNKQQTESLSNQVKALSNISINISQQGKINAELTKLNKKIILQINIIIFLFGIVISIILALIISKYL